MKCAFIHIEFVRRRVDGLWINGDINLCVDFGGRYLTCCDNNLLLGPMSISQHRVVQDCRIKGGKLGLQPPFLCVDKTC